MCTSFQEENSVTNHSTIHVQYMLQRNCRAIYYVRYFKNTMRVGGFAEYSRS